MKTIVELSVQEAGRKAIANLCATNLPESGDEMVVKVKKGGPLETVTILKQMTDADECHQYKITADLSAAKITVKKK